MYQPPIHIPSHIAPYKPIVRKVPRIPGHTGAGHLGPGMGGYQGPGPYTPHPLQGIAHGLPGGTQNPLVTKLAHYLLAGQSTHSVDRYGSR